LKASDPDEVYNLAASSFVGTSFEEAVENTEITGVAVTKFLEAVLHQNSDIKFYQASTSEMFGNSKVVTQNESTPFLPNSPYAASKLYAHWITNMYRDSYDMFACAGILFNHESPLRGLQFVSRKITNSVAQISLGLKNKLVLGNLKAKRDWGFAGEYVDAIHKMMQQRKPDNFVISTGESHSVSEFAKEAFDLVGLNWKKYVKSDPRFFRPLEVDYLRGNAQKSLKHLKWKPKITFKKLVKLMLDADLKRWNDFLDGKAFPWDAPLYPEETNLITRLSNKKKRRR
jgi:GDPmannose 4,6-dehydratase